MGNIGVDIVTLDSLISPTIYTLNLTFTSPNLGNNTSTNQTKTYDWVVTVSPALPIGKQINFSISHSSTSIYGTANNGTPTLSYSQSTGTTGGGLYLTSTGPFITSATATTVPCTVTSNYPNHVTTTTIRQYTARILGTGGNDSVNGSVTQSVTVINGGNPCEMFASIDDSISITNVQIVSQNQCESVNTTVNPISFGVSKTGTILTQTGNNTFVGG